MVLTIGGGGTYLISGGGGEIEQGAPLSDQQSGLYINKFNCVVWGGKEGDTNIGALASRYKHGGHIRTSLVAPSSFDVKYRVAKT